MRRLVLYLFEKGFKTGFSVVPTFFQISVPAAGCCRESPDQRRGLKPPGFFWDSFPPGLKSGAIEENIR
jgi:hypothetical protein